MKAKLIMIALLAIVGIVAVTGTASAELACNGGDRLSWLGCVAGGDVSPFEAVSVAVLGGVR